MTEQSSVLVGHYNSFLVLVSVAIAILSAHAALDLTERVTYSRGACKSLWLIGGTIAMGTGIWSMHYIGMLAFQLPVMVEYDWPTVLLSLLAAILASGCALYCATRPTMGKLVTIVGGLCMGAGIAAMHYIGMMAMRLPAVCTYSPGLVTLSVLVAVGISFVAVWRTSAFRRVSHWSHSRVINAVLLGAAIPVMHYVGMAAAQFRSSPLMLSGSGHAVNISDLGVTGVAVITVVMLGLVFVTSTVDRNFGRQALALKESEQRYRKIVESTFDAFLAMDGTGRITDWSTQAETMFGWNRTEAIGMNVGQMLLWERQLKGSPVTLREMMAENAQGVQERIEVTSLHRDGHEFSTEAAISSVRIGKDKLFIVFAHDVTKRKIQEKEQEQATAAAEQASRVKGEFLANMSHEIRTPLNGVIGMTDLVLETELTREQRDYLETVKLSADALLSVINAILDFSKIEAGKVNLEEVDFELRDCMETALRTLALQADEKGLELLCDVAAEIPDLVHGDSGKLRQVLVNLVGNAIKFTDEGEVALKVQLDRMEGDRLALHFVVSDTGIGIAKDKLEAIFESFVQADTSTTREFGGTGLGLTISKRLVEIMGGKVWIESELGVGSHFHFTIEAARSKAKLSKAPAVPVEILAGVRVLVIDDNRTNRRILDGLLRSWGMEPTVVSGAEEALAVLAGATRPEHAFRLIVTDRHMPKMDGFGLIEALRQVGGSPTSTIMMLSSAGQGGDAARCKELGIAAYLLKPVRKMELREAIVRVVTCLDQSTFSAPMITRDSLQRDRDPAECLDILVAEDNLVNQKLAKRLLEKRGHTVRLVGNGREAAAALAEKDYDLVLMDIQMPELDGIAVTTLLREREKLTGTRQFVVAMTALAMKSDRERCLAAGMDGYLAKPIRGPELDDVLEGRIMQQNKLGQVTASAPAATPGSVNAEELLERLDGDRAFLAELTELFRGDYPRQIRAIQEAIEQNDAVGVKQASHALKGALCNLAALRAGEMAADLERIGGSGDLELARRSLGDLEKELVNTLDSLHYLCQETAS
jgi:two-component system, sensor histidine kinase and response regulator